MTWGELVFVENWLIPRGEAYLLTESNTFVLHPSDMLLQRGKGRFPFETRYTPGIRELERDRRRHRG